MAGLWEEVSLAAVCSRLTFLTASLAPDTAIDLTHSVLDTVALVLGVQPLARKCFHCFTPTLHFIKGKGTRFKTLI